MNVNVTEIAVAILNMTSFAIIIETVEFGSKLLIRRKTDKEQEE